MATGSGARNGKGPASKGAAPAPALKGPTFIERQIHAARGSSPLPTVPLNTKTAKFHRLIGLLQSGGPGMSIRHISTALSVDERTVKRYLADLRRLKFDLVQEADARGRKTLYRIPGPGGPPTHLLSSLKKIRSELIAGGNPKYSALISQVLRHLEEKESDARGPGQAAADAPADLPAVSASDLYYIDHGPFAEADPHPGILKILEGAIAARTAVRVSYSSYAKDAEEILFFPYVLCLRVGTLYLIGRQGENKGPFKSLSVKRIKRGIATRDTFQPEAFNPADYYKYTFGQWHRQLNEDPETVTLLLREAWLEKYLSESHFNPPGRIVRKGKEVLFELKVVVKPDFVNWVLSLAPDLVPVKPDSLRKSVAERLAAGLKAVSD